MTAAQDNQYAKVASFGVAYSANFLLFTAIAPIPCWHEMLNKYGTGCLKEEELLLKRYSSRTQVSISKVIGNKADLLVFIQLYISIILRMTKSVTSWISLRKSRKWMAHEELLAQSLQLVWEVRTIRRSGTSQEAALTVLPLPKSGVEPGGLKD